MATYTEKLGLKLPSQTDFYNVDDFNENFRKLDQNTAQSGDIQHVLTLADPIRSNRAPTTADAQFAGKLWVVPKMIFNNMMPDALTQVASNWKCTASTSSASGSSATIVGDGTASTIVSEVDMTAVRANDVVYINAKMTVTADANGAIIELLCGDDVIATTSMSIPTAGDSTQLVAYTKVDEAGALKLRVTTMYNSASAQLGKGVTISDITILDLTADMCQNFVGIEFTKDETTTYISTYGMFQTKTYELSEYWWICRGSYGGQYSWQRYDDYTNAKVQEYSDSYQNSKATTAEAQAGTNDTHWMTPLKTQQFLTNKLATQAEAQTGSDNTKVMTPLRVANQITAKIATTAEAQAGTNDTKIMTPLKSQQFLTNRAATDAEVAAGTVTNKWTNPKQVAKAATTFRDDATGKNCTATLGLDHFKFSSVTVSIGLSDLIDFVPRGSIVYNNQIFFFGNTNVRASAGSSSYNYYFKIIAISLDTLELTWNSGNLFQVYDNDYFSYLRPCSYSYTCISADGSVVLMRYESNNMAIVDLKNKTVHYGFSTSSFRGAFATNNYVGYMYASSNSSTYTYYKARSSSGNSFTSKSMGVTPYNSYSYIGPAGVSGDILTFIYMSASNTWTTGQFNIATNAISTGKASVSTNSLSCQYSMQLLNGKVFIPAQTSNACGFVVVTPSTGAASLKVYTQLYNTDLYNAAQWYMGTYNNLMYYFGFRNYNDNSYNLVAFNRDTGDLVSQVELDSSSYTINTKKETNPGFERIFTQPWLANDENVLDLLSGTYRPLRGPMYPYNSEVRVYILGSYPNVMQGQMPDNPFVGLYSYKKNSTNYKLTLIGAFEGPIKSISSVKYET